MVTGTRAEGESDGAVPEPQADADEEERDNERSPQTTSEVRNYKNLLLECYATQFF